jgi:hypothetical protein
MNNLKIKSLLAVIPSVIIANYSTKKELPHVQALLQIY